MAKKQALGRGLDAIFGDVEQAYRNNLSDHREKLVELDINLIKPNPYQPRKIFQEESIKELAESIEEHGLLQPIIVYQDEDDGYALIAGERRLRASKLAGKDSIRAIIADIDLAKLRELALIENIQRENLNPIDLAKSYQELLEDYKITHEELAQKIKKSRAQITNTLRLLSLIPEIQTALVEGRVTQGHAKVLVGLEEGDQKILLSSILGQKLSVRDTEEMAQNFKNKVRERGVNIKNLKGSGLLDLRDLQREIEKMDLRTKVSQDKIIIEFKNQEEVLLLVQKLLK